MGKFWYVRFWNESFYSNKVFFDEFKSVKSTRIHVHLHINNNDGTYVLHEQQWIFHVQICICCVQSWRRACEWVSVCELCVSNACSLNLCDDIICNKRRFCAFTVTEYKPIWLELTNRECCRTFRIPIIWMVVGVAGTACCIWVLTMRFLAKELLILLHLSSGHEPALSLGIYQCLNSSSQHTMHMSCCISLRCCYASSIFQWNSIHIYICCDWICRHFDLWTKQKLKPNERKTKNDLCGRLCSDLMVELLGSCEPCLIVANSNTRTHQANERF